MKRLASIGVFAGALLATSQAFAAPETHDGFYLELGLGLGYLSTTAEAGPFETTLSGMTIPSHLLLGGTPVPGLVIGGGVMTDYSFSPSGETSGGQTVTLNDVSLYLVGIGAFVNYYLKPEGGLHIQLFGGFGALEATQNGNAGGSDPVGLIIAPGVGYDFFIGSEWSFGVLGRFAYAPLKLNETSYNTIAPALLATLTFH